MLRKGNGDSKVKRKKADAVYKDPVSGMERRFPGYVSLVRRVTDVGQGEYYTFTMDDPGDAKHIGSLVFSHYEFDTQHYFKIANRDALNVWLAHSSDHDNWALPYGCIMTQTKSPRHINEIEEEDFPLYATRY
jgi:hypothetical protein